MTMSAAKASFADTVTIRALTPGDAATIARIYQDGIDPGHATFEPSAPDWGMWNRDHRPDCRLAAMLDVDVVGWAALLPVSVRPAYAGVAEIIGCAAARPCGGGTVGLD